MLKWLLPSWVYPVRKSMPEIPRILCRLMVQPGELLLVTKTNTWIPFRARVHEMDPKKCLLSLNLKAIDQILPLELSKLKKFKNENPSLQVKLFLEIQNFTLQSSVIQMKEKERDTCQIFFETFLSQTPEERFAVIDWLEKAKAYGFIVQN